MLAQVEEIIMGFALTFVRTFSVVEPKNESFCCCALMPLLPSCE